MQKKATPLRQKKGPYRERNLRRKRQKRALLEKEGREYGGGGWETNCRRQDSPPRRGGGKNDQTLLGGKETDLIRKRAVALELIKAKECCAFMRSLWGRARRHPRTAKRVGSVLREGGAGFGKEGGLSAGKKAEMGFPRQFIVPGTEEGSLR